jgi:hypothetical protein
MVVGGVVATAIAGIAVVACGWRTRTKVVAACAVLVVWLAAPAIVCFLTRPSRLERAVSAQATRNGVQPGVDCHGVHDTQAYVCTIHDMYVPVRVCAVLRKRVVRYLALRMCGIDARGSVQYMD